MKNNSGSRTGRILKRVFNVRSWSDWERTRSSTQFISDAFKKLFTIERKEKKAESFQEVVVRLGLTQEDLQLRQKGLMRLVYLMVSIVVVLFLYVLYQLFWGTIFSAMASFSLMLIALSLAFRYHFWYYQIKQQKLGCTLREWFKQGVWGEPS